MPIVVTARRVDACDKGVTARAKLGGENRDVDIV